ncbi:DASS family sodium-coupled anion symporter [Sulfurimonas paralvinellae]|uniref:DASS family sodium-coupled anion symporter n=1 Tax=Sulfurimonas paralvinellae TaxID=317658 RepID=A0A7M1B8B7_9BACT|nr:DASS family sodium-coupled anion symporter [Sulfurimonas paralvinellae]QOP45970.1 DASS family sodium-coupled anion symporter [Sulfurimonas paralvinellae]
MAHHKYKTIRQHYKQLFILLFGTALWFFPIPDGLTLQAWHLFTIFISIILAVIIEATSIFTASIIGLGFVIVTHTLTTKQAYSGFSQGFILLIIIAFLIARGVIKSGLGKRIALLIIKRFGKSSLGLGYSIVAADMFIAPAFPSNTARSGVLYPIVQALSSDSGSKVADGTRKKLGSYLMMTSMAGLTISSAMWLTAMAANPAGAKMAKEFGVEISYGSWALASFLPSLIAFITIPWLLFKIFPPDLKKTPNAPVMAQHELEHMGAVHKNEYIMGFTFIAMITLWIFSAQLGIDKTAVAFLGLGILMLSNIFTLDDLAHEGRALGTLIWFGTLYAMSSYLNEFGFMSWLGVHISNIIMGESWPIVYVGLILAYVFIHYFFVSQTAQMLALFSVFLGVGINAGVPAELLALMLLFATNFNAMITPQGSSANVIYLSSGYIESREVYKYGGVVTLANTIIYLGAGTAWILLIF